MPFPSDVGFQIAGYGRTDSKIVERSDMERGPAKTRRTASNPIATVSAKLRFRTQAIEEAFDAWYYSVAGANAGAAWFDWTDPRTGVVHQARVVSLGQVTPTSATLSEQPIELEYVREVAP